VWVDCISLHFTLTKTRTRVELLVGCGVDPYIKLIIITTLGKDRRRRDLQLPQSESLGGNNGRIKGKWKNWKCDLFPFEFHEMTRDMPCDDNQESG